MCGEYGYSEPVFEGPATDTEPVSSIDERWSDTTGIFVRFLPETQVEKVDMGGYEEYEINPRD
jgi:hypothetical protein